VNKQAWYQQGINPYFAPSGKKMFSDHWASHMNFSAKFTVYQSWVMNQGIKMCYFDEKQW
jgi:hypothetical protein